jgi:hypothetical protein
MEANHVAGLVLATALWIGLAACAVLGGSIRPPGEFWTSTSSDKVRSHPTLVRAAYPTVITTASGRRADAGHATLAAWGM